MFDNTIREPSGVPSSLGGSYFGNSHWKAVSYTSHTKKTPYTVFVDTSVKVQYRGREVHPVYLEKDLCIESWIISSASLFTTPFYAAAAIAYHTFRFVIVPFYLLLTAAIESCRAKSGKKLEAAWDQIKVIPYEMGISLWMVVATPFCAVGWALGHIYTLIDPSRYYYGDSLNGRKLTAHAEYLWNRAIPLAEGTWLGIKEDWFDARNGAYPFYMDGCYQSQGCFDPNTNQVQLYIKNKAKEGTEAPGVKAPYPSSKAEPWQSCWPCCVQKSSKTTNLQPSQQLTV